MSSLKAYLIQPLWVTRAAQSLISLIFSFDLMFNLSFSVAVRVPLRVTWLHLTMCPSSSPEAGGQREVYSEKRQTQIPLT